MDIFSAIVVMVPLIAPAAARYGVDPYHLGVIFLLNLEIGYLTPPVGLNLFVTSFRFQRPIADVVRAALPFLFLMMAVLGLVTYIPALTVVRDAKKQVGGESDAADAGAVAIPFPDGGVWTPERCEREDIKSDAISYEECKSAFKYYPTCASIEGEMDKLDCQTLAIAGANWLAAADAGTVEQLLEDIEEGDDEDEDEDGEDGEDAGSDEDDEDGEAVGLDAGAVDAAR
jgi:hypothetical protein